MHGSFNTQAVQEFYSAFDGLSTPMFSEGEHFDFSRTAKSVPKPKVSVKRKSSKAEQKLAKAEQVLEMAEELYKRDSSEENYEKVYLAETLLRYTELAFAEEFKAFEEELQYSESYDAMDFTRCVRPNGTAYGTRGKCRKGTESAEESAAVEQLSGMLPKGEKIVTSSGKTVTSGGRGKSSLDKQIEDAYKREQAAREAGDTDAARKAMKEHMALVKQAESKSSGKSKEDKAREIMAAIKQESDPERQRDLIAKLEDVNNPLIKLPGGRVARTINIKSPYEL